MAPGTEPTGDWYQIVGPSIGITLVGLLAFIASYFKKSPELETTPVQAVVAKSIGAAFVDDSVSAAIMRIDKNVEALAKAAKEHADKEQEHAMAERVAEELERRMARSRKDDR